MNIKELVKKLREKNIKLSEFDLEYIVPCIRIEKGKEMVEEFDLKFKRSDDNNYLWGGKMITRKDLHKVEMELVSLCDDFIIQTNEVTTLREAIINKFTNLMNEVEWWQAI